MTNDYYQKYHQKIWDKILSSNEKVEFSFSIGNSYRKFYLILWAIICAPLLFAFGMGIIVYAFVYFYYGFYLKVANVYAFTNKRVLIHRGWLSTQTNSIAYDKITDIVVSENFVDRVLTKTGGIALNTAGTSHYEGSLRFIENPYQIKKKLEEIINKAK